MEYVIKENCPTNGGVTSMSQHSSVDDVEQRFQTLYLTFLQKTELVLPCREKRMW